jgi:uncharacterized protein
MASAVASVAEIPAADWNRLANPQGAPFNPLVTHEFFLALERSGSATARTGWAGRHRVLRDEAGAIAGIAPCYLKSHSRGEYVFDHGWAEAFERAGGRYYPKLQVAVPFTPVTGPRLFAATQQHRAQLAQALITQCTEDRASSVHVTFLPQSECAELANPRWLTRTDIQFHWHNAAYTNFDEFLRSLSSQKRKNIRKEREQVREAGISFLQLTGRDISETHWDHFFQFYMETGSRKWGSPYLTRRFFSLIGESLSEYILLVLAVRAGRIIAGALNFIGGDALFGRNWGAIEHHPCLHFETCYYQAIEFAIARRLQRVEAGAQGPHKLARGYLPQTTYSLHYLAHPGLSRAVSNYLEAERAGVAEEAEALAGHSPFRHEQDF